MKDSRVAVVMFSGLIKGTSGNVVIHFTEVGTGRLFKWSTSSDTEAARDFICTGMGNYQVPIMYNERGSDINGCTVISHVKIKRDLMK